MTSFPDAALGRMVSRRRTIIGPASLPVCQPEPISVCYHHDILAGLLASS